MALTDIQIKSAKPREKQYKLADGEGMYLLVLPSGGKYWRLKYRIDGKEKVLALGVYPKVSLSGARGKRRVAKDVLSDGQDPSVIKKLEKIKRKYDGKDSFEAVAREWHKKQKTSLAEVTARDTLSKLVNHVFPHVGARTIGEITTPEVLAVLRRLESNGKISAAHRTKQIIGRVFRYAIVTGRATHDLAADLKGALAPEVTKHHASITDPKKIGELLRKIDDFSGTLPVKSALQLAPMLFVRPGELRRAEWKDVNFDTRQWIIPKEVMKKVGKERRAHIVPLSTQAIDILKKLRKYTGENSYLFSTKDKPMSENSVNKALRSIGYSGKEAVGHGFRTTASTILHEQGYLSDAIERQLAHVEGNDVKRTYNKALHIKERTKMMQAWSDYLYGLKADRSDKLIQLKVAS